jgi:type IV pilus assembly protein PilM
MIGTKKEFISLDFGYSGIKAAKLKVLKKNSIVLSDFVYETFPSADLENVNFDYINRKAGEFLDKNDIRGHVVFSMSDPSLIVQNFKLPQMPYDEIPEAVKWEVSRSLKLDPTEIFYDFIINTNSPEGEKEGIYILAGISSRSPYEQMAKTLMSRKLKILGCDISMLCDFRALDHMGFFNNDKTYVCINLGALFTNLSVVHKKEVIFNRRISLNGNLLTKAIRDYCRVDLSQAENLKDKYGLNTDEMSDKIIESVNIVNTNCEKMVSDIQYSLKYFSFQVSRSTITAFDKLYITGGASKLRGFVDFLKERLVMDIVPVQLEGGLVIEKPTMPENYDVPAVLPHASTVTGGLLWDRKDLNKTCMNMLPGHLTEGGKKEFVSYRTVVKRVFSSFGSLLLLFAALISLYLVFKWQHVNIKMQQNIYAQKETLKEQIERKNQEFLALKETLSKENDDVEAEIKLMQSKIEEFKSFEVNKMNTAAIVREAVNSVPYPEIVLSILSLDNDRIILQGDAINNNVVSIFMKNLNNTNYFYSTNFDFMEKTTQEKQQYPINFKIGTKTKTDIK